MQYRNSTALDSDRLQALLLEHTAPYRHAELRVHVRYSRSAAFSGTCFFREARILVNLGRANRYPFTLAVNVAKAESTRYGWRRELLQLTVADGYHLALFVYLHELFHHLVAVAGRAPRRKEAMCDRFATRILVDRCGAKLTDAQGAAVARGFWDFKDLGEFVFAAAQPARRANPGADSRRGRRHDLSGGR